MATNIHYAGGETSDKSVKEKLSTEPREHRYALQIAEGMISKLDDPIKADEQHDVKLGTEITLSMNSGWFQPDTLKRHTDILDYRIRRHMDYTGEGKKYKDFGFAPHPASVWEDVKEEFDFYHDYDCDNFSDLEEEAEQEAKEVEHLEDLKAKEKRLSVTKNNGVLYERHKWRRPERIQVAKVYEDMQWTIFNHPMSTDVEEGKLSASWLLSSICVIADRRELLDKILYTKETNEERIYGLLLCVDGKWTDFCVNDEFPCHADGRLACSQAKRKQLWVTLIEKALASLYDCYELVLRGSMALGLKLLTGYSVEILYLETNKFGEGQGPWFEKLKDALKDKDSVIVTNTESSEINFGENYCDDLIASHAYEIKDLIPDFAHGPLARLRDVRGGDGWQGDWSDMSTKWDHVEENQWPAGKSRHSDDGLFWMSIDDLMRYFPTLSILRIRNDWFEYCVKVDLPQAKEPVGVQSPTLTVEEETRVDIHAENERRTSDDYRASTASSLEMIMIIVDEKGRVVSSMMNDASRNIMWSGKLMAGGYRVICVSFSIWHINHKKRSRQTYELVHCNVRFHSDKLLKLRREVVPYTDFCKAVLSMVVEDGTLEEDRDENSPVLLYELQKFSASKTLRWSGKIFAAVNKSETDAYYVNIQPTVTENARSTRTVNKVVTTKDLLPPKTGQILQVVTKVDPTKPLVTYYNSDITKSNAKYTDPQHEPALEEFALHYLTPIDDLDVLSVI